MNRVERQRRKELVAVEEQRRSAADDRRRDALRAFGDLIAKSLDAYIAVHEDMFGRRGFARFKRIDFAADAQKLDRLCTVLEFLRCQPAALRAEFSLSGADEEFVRVAESYLVALTDSVVRLGLIAVSLGGKIHGKSYAMPTYRADVAEYEGSVYRYSILGTELKEAWDRAGL